MDNCFWVWFGNGKNCSLTAITADHLGQQPRLRDDAEAYGLPAGTACDGESLKEQINHALAAEGPYIVHCLINPDENVFPMIPAGKMPQDLIMPGMGD